MFYFYWQTIKHGMERSGKTWSGGIKRGVMKHVLPLHVLSLHVLSLHTRFYRMPLLIWCRPPQSVIICLVVSRLYKMMPFVPQLLFFLTCDFFFLLSFCPPWPTQNVETHLTQDKKGMVLAHVLPLGRPTTKLTRRGIRSVDKLLNGYALLDLQRFLKTHELWSSKANWSLRFSLLSIILADLLGQRTLLKRVQKAIVCDLWLADFHPFCLFLRFKVRCLWS